MAYLTPDRFKTMRTGASTTDLPDIEIAEVIEDASAIVDAYCNVPLLPVPHSFLGGTIVDEEHKWKYPEHVFDSGQRRVYLFHHPIREVTSFQLFVSADASATLPVEQFMVNNTEKWIEVTSLAIASSSGLFGVTGWVVPLGGLASPVARISYTYGQTFTETLERAYPVDDTNLVYQTKHGFWQVDVDHEVEVTANGVAVDPGDYTTDEETGRLTFTVEPSAPVRVTYSHKLNRDFASATAHITAALLGEARQHTKFSGGVTKMKVGEISIERHAAPKDIALYLDQTVPKAALLLMGHKFWWMA